MTDKADTSPKSRAEGATPSMQQYFAIKEEHPNALLFFRMGDFYELFFEDAIAAAEALDIALTKRGKHQGEDIPMCGAPAHAAEGYLHTLTRKGFTIAICDQTEDPKEAKKRGSKAVVRREVVRIVTPGTLSEDSLLDPRAHNYLAAYANLRGEAALGWADMSSGEIAVTRVENGSLPAELSRLSPSEIIIPESLFETAQDSIATLEEAAPVTPLAGGSFDTAHAERRLCDVYKVASLDAFGAFDRAELAALGGLIEYLSLTQKGRMPHLLPPKREESGRHMHIDAATRRNLELTETISGTRKGSLLASIDRTMTGAGARMLAEWISAPLTVAAAVHARLDAVSLMREDSALTEELRERLRTVPDISRALSRLSLGRGGPRDLAALRDGLSAAGVLARRLDALNDPPTLLAEAAFALEGHAPLADRLRAMLIDEPPHLTREGGFIASGVDAALDEHRGLRDDSRQIIRDMEVSLKAETGISSLKLKFNNVLGYFIEVPAAHGDKLLGKEEFIHRQTMANAVRFTTGALADLDGRIARAGAQAIERELALFEQAREAVLERAGAISACATALALLDTASALGELAAAEGWVRPVVDDSTAFAIEGGRHPVVEAALRAEAHSFVANDCDLSAERLWLLTGPNMAGKSTFLRQNALIALLAQSGSFVPAGAAHIGIVDRLFSRVGASDDLARGRSTFMVEMVETAAILNQSGARALVILDEIGRGTATFDGLSIAWATLEHLHDVNGCRGLFATHYHELTELVARLDGAKNAAMKVAEYEGDIVFLHEVEGGAATRSYGVQVAKKAGLPAAVIARARDVLSRLESGDASGGEARIRAVLDDLPLFAAMADAAEDEAAGVPALEAALAEIDPDALTPREALEALYRLKSVGRLEGLVPYPRPEIG